MIPDTVPSPATIPDTIAAPPAKHPWRGLPHSLAAARSGDAPRRFTPRARPALPSHRAEFNATRPDPATLAPRRAGIGRARLIKRVLISQAQDAHLTKRTQKSRAEPTTRHPPRSRHALSGRPTIRQPVGRGPTPRRDGRAERANSASPNQPYGQSPGTPPNPPQAKAPTRPHTPSHGGASNRPGQQSRYGLWPTHHATWRRWKCRRASSDTQYRATGVSTPLNRPKQKHQQNPIHPRAVAPPTGPVSTADAGSGQHAMQRGAGGQAAAFRATRRAGPQASPPHTRIASLPSPRSASGSPNDPAARHPPRSQHAASARAGGCRPGGGTAHAAPRRSHRTPGSRFAESTPSTAAQLRARPGRANAPTRPHTPSHGAASAGFGWHRG